MNITGGYNLDLNGSQALDVGQIVSSSLDFLGSVSTTVKGWIESIGINFPGALYSVLTAFIGVLLLYIGSKITNKFARFALWILGAILIIGLAYSLIGRIG